MDRCTNCGAMVRPDAKFCTACGRRLLPVDTVTPPAAPTASPPGSEPIAAGPGKTAVWPLPSEQPGAMPPQPAEEPARSAPWGEAPASSAADTSATAASSAEKVPTARSWQESRWGARSDWRTASQPESQPWSEPEPSAEPDVIIGAEPEVEQPAAQPEAAASVADTQPFVVPDTADPTDTPSEDAVFAESTEPVGTSSTDDYAERDVLIETTVVDLPSDSATDFPPEPSDEAAIQDEFSRVEPLEDTSSSEDQAAEPESIEFESWVGSDESPASEDSDAGGTAESWVRSGTVSDSNQTSWITPLAPEEQSDDDWGDDAGTDEDAGTTWFEDIDDELNRAQATAEANEAEAQAPTSDGQEPEAESTEVETDEVVTEATTGEDADETVDSHEPVPDTEAASTESGMMVAWSTTRDIAEHGIAAGGAAVSRAQDLLMELRSLIPSIAGHHATIAEAFRNSGVDPTELLERINALSTRTDSASVQDVATIAAHAEGREQDVHELMALMEHRAAIEDIAQTVLDQQLVLDDIAAVLRSVNEDS